MPGAQGQNAKGRSASFGSCRMGHAQSEWQTQLQMGRARAEWLGAFRMGGGIPNGLRIPGRVPQFLDGLCIPEVSRNPNPLPPSFGLLEGHRVPTPTPPAPPPPAHMKVGAHQTWQTAGCEHP